ncbi:MAG: nicotinate (nicotinamide) nucleotide adenylyltransferase [Clostridia bacterium]|nr:nicotinate (nicotinamide) nucleotide adenylyltransferase [Clostridia bacterium]
MNLGIFGGTFNPIHMGHIRASLRFYDKAGLDRLLVIPDRIPPHKEGFVARSEDRLAMLHLVYGDRSIVGDRSIEISEVELRREGKSYTVVTLRELSRQYPDARLFLYTGSDMFYTLESWREGAEILRMCTVFTLAREENERERLLEYAELYREKYGTECIIAEDEPLVVSSTEIRGIIAESGKKNGNFTNNLLTDTVKEYIMKNRLYTDGENNLGELVGRVKCDLPGYLGEKRLSHVLAVTETAELLADFLIGKGAELCRERVTLAALLHDITKYMNQTELCDEYGIMLSEDDALSLPTLHALTGAYFARSRYGIDDEIFDAVKNHSVGAENMALTDKIIFISDYCEATRTYEECKKSREMMLRIISEAKSLDGALYGLDYLAADILGKTLCHLRESGGFIHGGTMRSFRYLVSSHGEDAELSALYGKYIK